MPFQIELADGETSFACADSQSILDAARAAGIELPHACRQGICGNCAGGIVHGDVRGLAGEPPANAFCQPGQVLFCRSAPASDLVIRPSSWRRSDATGRKRVTVKVYRNTLVAPDVSVLELRLVAGQRVRFRAGQYLKIGGAGQPGRHYSMANPPQESDAITLHVRHLPGGLFTSKLPALAAGDPLQVELPFGDFCVPEEEQRPLVFVATGTGFAPIKSIIDDSLKRGLRRKTTLIWGARSLEGLYLLNAVQAWTRRSPDLRFIPALSGGDVASLPGAYRGRVDAALQQNFRSLQGHALYCCGSAPMIKSVFDMAIRLGLAPADFHADAFVRAANAPD